MTYAAEWDSSQAGYRRVRVAVRSPHERADAREPAAPVARTRPGEGPALGDAHLRRPLLGARSPTRSTARNLAKGQTGLSVAFDLPTQTGYDPDHPLARGEVGKVGVPIPHLGEMRRLFDDIPLAEMNTSMTINATAMWLLALYQVVAEEQAREGADLEAVHASSPAPPRTTSSRSTSRAGPTSSRPSHSLRLTSDMIAYTVNNIPKWNPINICSYHLQEAGATPVAGARLRAVHGDRGARRGARLAARSPTTTSSKVVGRISFFVNAGVRFVEEMCKMRAFVQLWDEITRERYGVAGRQAAPVPLRRAGQLARPDRGAAGEQRAADRAGDARRDAVQGRPRPRRPAARVERGARPAAALGPAVVAAPPAGAGLRVRPAGVRRPLRRLARRRGQGRRARRGRARRDRPGAGAWAARSRPSSPAT